MSIEQIHDLFLKSTGISTDSRSIWNGCIYIALKGERFDGNEFAKQAIEQGASHAIVDDDAMIGENLIQVQDGLLTLQKLASYHRVFCGWPTLGITGSNGKTTTKEFLLKIFREAMSPPEIQNAVSDRIKEHRARILKEYTGAPTPLGGTPMLLEDIGKKPPHRKRNSTVA